MRRGEAGRQKSKARDHQGKGKAVILFFQRTDIYVVSAAGRQPGIQHGRITGLIFLNSKDGFIRGTAAVLTKQKHRKKSAPGRNRILTGRTGKQRKQGIHGQQGPRRIEIRQKRKRRDLAGGKQAKGTQFSRADIQGGKAEERQRVRSGFRRGKRLKLAEKLFCVRKGEAGNQRRKKGNQLLTDRFTGTCIGKDQGRQFLGSCRIKKQGSEG